MGTLGSESISIMSVVRPVFIVRPVFGHFVRMSGIGGIEPLIDVAKRDEEIGVAYRQKRNLSVHLLAMSSICNI
jgi:hypothetical protein